MRVEPVVALIASAALHAGVLMYVPGTFDSRESRMPEATTPGVVIVAHLKNTLDFDNATRTRSTPGTGSAAGAAAEPRKPRVDNRMHFYPPEAVARGIEGETILILRYAADGRLLDARVARSSGHAILDRAALRAVRATPRIADGPREVLFPVTFALH